MPFTAGTFALYTPGNPVVTGTTISITWANNTLTDIATGLSTCVLKDGTQTVTANIPMAGFRLTGLGSATALTDAIRYDAVQNSSPTFLTATAGTNTVTATAANSLAAYATGQEFTFIPANTNTAATTLNVNAIGAKNVFCGGAACVGGELRANVPVRVQYDGTQFNIIGPYVGGNLPTGQIKFPATQNPSSDANTLDDYEEGTWTPALGGTTTYTTQVGLYTKVGRGVHLQGHLTINALGSGSTTTVSGVPFSAAASPGVATGVVGYYTGLALSTIFLSCYVNGGTTTLFFNSQAASGAGMTANAAVWGNAAQIAFQVTYSI